jgi:hypothetical protein
MVDWLEEHRLRLRAAAEAERARAAAAAEVDVSKTTFFFLSSTQILGFF